MNTAVSISHMFSSSIAYPCVHTLLKEFKSPLHYVNALVINYLVVPLYCTFFCLEMQSSGRFSIDISLAFLIVLLGAHPE